MGCASTAFPMGWCQRVSEHGQVRVLLRRELDPGRWVLAGPTDTAELEEGETNPNSAAGEGSSDLGERGCKQSSELLRTGCP